MWQSRVEIEHYSVACFDHVAELLLKVGLIRTLLRDYGLTIYMRQSRVEIEHYSFVYFNHITAFKRRSAELPLRVGLIHAL